MTIEVNKIYQGHVLEVLKTFPDECIDMVITSPPYYGLRDYQAKEQIGLEPVFDCGQWGVEKGGCGKCYMCNLLDITWELKRVLKKSGQLWWNHGDCYGGLQGKYNGYPDQKLKKGEELPIIKNREGHVKCMMMQPERLAIAMVDKQGFILRNKIIWAKQILVKKEGRTIGSVMPTSVKDRFNESWEYLYFFTKNKKYYSNLDEVRIPNQVVGVTDLRSPRVIRQSLYENSKYHKNIDYGGQKFNLRVRDAVRKAGQPGYVATEEELTSYIARKHGYDPEGICPICGRKWKRHASPNASDRKAGLRREFIPCIKLAVKEEIERYKQETGKIKGGGANLNLPWNPTTGGKIYESKLSEIGKNVPSVWQISPEPHNFQKELGVDAEHFAVFPEMLIEIPIKFGCPEGGIVLDPFFGSGTTGVVAKKLGRNWVGIELNPDYVKIAEERIKRTVVQERLL